MRLNRWLKSELKKIFSKMHPAVKASILVGLVLFVLISAAWEDEGTLEDSQSETAGQEILGEQTVELSPLGELLIQPEFEQLEMAMVTGVVDGDTIIIDDNNRVRLIGVDTPETVHPQKEVECFGPEASAYTTSLLLDQQIYLEKDISEIDRYGRLLRYVWLDGMMINQLLVRQGYAQVVSYPPDIKYHQHFLIDQEMAREAEMGLWGDACQSEE